MYIARQYAILVLLCIPWPLEMMSLWIRRGDPMTEHIPPPCQPLTQVFSWGGSRVDSIRLKFCCLVVNFIVPAVPVIVVACWFGPGFRLYGLAAPADTPEHAFSGLC
ncbi:hypothetical protein B0T20DRAFT_178361 [Sordaria brevicollis]|uniref:Uncharacterized protein n=1 Tax=Sordaria brevicollis TaxID=83679 RepID=A0AAE0UDG6_SORBR|nr:hypothetical protein B0T20DRAFT_178361 [Sordaria brevicollis]